MRWQIQLTIEYEQVVKLVEQLSDEQREALITRLLAQRSDPSLLSADEKLALYHNAIMSVPLNEIPSLRREDWYGDDGR